MRIKDKALIDRCNAAAEQFKSIFKDVPLVKNPADGTITADEKEFSWINNGLVLIGFCPVCNQEVASRPIRRAADVADLMENFRPGKHNCMDV